MQAVVVGVGVVHVMLLPDASVAESPDPKSAKGTEAKGEYGTATDAGFSSAAGRALHRWGRGPRARRRGDNLLEQLSVSKVGALRGTWGAASPVPRRPSGVSAQ